jgi:hypothetical protein
MKLGDITPAQLTAGRESPGQRAVRRRSNAQQMVRQLFRLVQASGIKAE